MKTVLVVEDTDDIRELFSEVLEEAGYRVLGAEHGQKALEVLESASEQPCLVLLDMMMPVMDGQTFLEKIQEKHRFGSMPVVIVSAMFSEGTVEGVRRVVKKPVTPQTLTQLARDFCGCPQSP
jgi:CheY-like chemotaxis protein